MGIVTDATPLEAPKDPEKCNVFQLYRLVASPEQTADLANRYRAGGLGYGHAKTELLGVLLDRFAEERRRFDALMADPAALHAALEQGAHKASAVADATLLRVREALGFA